jgi:hypothetical protein
MLQVPSTIGSNLYFRSTHSVYGFMSGRIRTGLEILHFRKENEKKGKDHAALLNL